MSVSIVGQSVCQYSENASSALGRTVQSEHPKYTGPSNEAHLVLQQHQSHGTTSAAKEYLRNLCRASPKDKKIVVRFAVCSSKDGVNSKLPESIQNQTIALCVQCNVVLIGRPKTDS